MWRKGISSLAGWLCLACILIATFGAPARTFKVSAAANTSALPVQKDVWKLALNTDGIYRLSYAELQAAGMDVAHVDPNRFEMMWRGESVAYQFEGDGDAQFEPGEALLFYGWRFNESRAERQYVKENVFWLWADGAPEMVPTVANEMGHRTVTAVSAEITKEPENIFSLTFTRHWDSFPNEPDSWYWQQLDKTAAQPTNHALTIDIPHPAPSGNGATYLVEILNRNKGNHVMTTGLNAHPAVAHAWSGKVNANLTQTVPQSTLTHGTNTVNFELSSEGDDRLYVNRITVNYQRQLITDDNTLQFSSMSGAQTFQLGGFSSSDTLHVWDITNRTKPVSIATHDSFDGQHHRVGGSFAGTPSFVAATDGQLQAVESISRYNGPQLDPAGGAEWLAIAHETLADEANRLAAHRSGHSRLTTHIVDVEDIINQYGYGLPLPDAIRDYLLHATSSWEIAPSYVTLVGGATLNPRQVSCQAHCYSTWNNTETTLVPAYMIYRDRQMGLMVTDHFYSTLVGDDDRSDISIGRLTSTNPQQLANVIDKIIQYESNLTSAENWMSNMLFLSDNTDGAGNFCNYHNDQIDTYTDQFDTSHYCLDDIDATSLRNKMFRDINDGVLISSYLGHGFVDKWASESLLSAQDTAQMTNQDKPYIQISGNCLDGHYAWVGQDAISETMLHLDNAGSVAHWGSTGLGYLIEHHVMHHYFSDALQNHGITRMGDAIRYSLNGYLDRGYYPGQAYSSMLMGDPAMQIAHPEISVTQTATHDYDRDIVQFTAIVRNDGVMPSPIALTQTIPSALRLLNVAVSSNATYSVPATDGGGTVQLPGNKILVNVERLGMRETATVVVTARLSSERTATQAKATVTVESEGFEVNVDDNSAELYINTGRPIPVAVKISHTATLQPSQAMLWLIWLAVTFVSATYYPIRQVRRGDYSE